MNTIILADGSALALDENGYLSNWAAWTPEVAVALADREGITLTGDHWLVIEILRDYYREFETAPPMRVLVDMLRKRLDAADSCSRRLYRLFPAGPVRQGSRYAGLPEPVSCI